MRSFYKYILIILSLIILALLGFLFYKFNWLKKIDDAYFQLTKKSHTVGAVTVDRDANKIKITEISEPFWNTKTLSPVIGKAYKVDRLKNDSRPVHVEFTYNPKEIPEGIAPADLKLYKWHEENGKKYWLPIKSQVDTGRNIISADLKTFSVIAIKAPVWLVLTPEERQALARDLEKMQKNQSNFTCGVIMMMEEELLTDEYFYSRSGDENYEKHGCWGNDDVISVPYNYNIVREVDGKTKSYYMQALVTWQIDPKESITLDGWVVDLNGEAVENAQVIARKDLFGYWEKTVKTNKDGYYNLKLHSGEYTISVISKDGKCSSVSAGNQYCYEGDIYEPPFTRSRWQKNFTLKCGDFTIQADEPVELYSDSREPGATYALEGKSQAYKVSSQLLTKAAGGYGWEGNWKMDSDIKYEIRIKDNFAIAEGARLDLYEMVMSYGGIYSFSFTIPPKPRVGSSISMVGTLASGGYWNEYYGQGSIIINHQWKFNKNSPSTGQEDPIQSFNLECRFTQADETGAVLDCDPVYDLVEKDGVTLRIKRK